MFKHRTQGLPVTLPCPAAFFNLLCSATQKRRVIGLLCVRSQTDPHALLATHVWHRIVTVHVYSPRIPKNTTGRNDIFWQDPADCFPAQSPAEPFGRGFRDGVHGARRTGDGYTTTKVFCWTIKRGWAEKGHQSCHVCTVNHLIWNLEGFLVWYTSDKSSLQFSDGIIT